MSEVGRSDTALIAFVTIVSARVRCGIGHRARHIGQRRADIVEERAQILAQQHHADSGDDGDERDQKRLLGRHRG